MKLALLPRHDSCSELAFGILLVHGPCCCDVLLLQESERAELERVSTQMAAERESLEAAVSALHDQQQQQAAASAELSAREAALEAQAGALQGKQSTLQAAQAAALRQLDSLEASLKSKLEGHQKQVCAACKEKRVSWLLAPVAYNRLCCACTRCCLPVHKSSRAQQSRVCLPLHPAARCLSCCPGG